MAHVLIMPRQGNTVESCIIVRWKVAEGAKVAADEAVCEVETDKASFDVPAGADGVLLKILKAEGEDVPVLDPIAVIGRKGEDWQTLIDKFGGLSPNIEAPTPASTLSQAGGLSPGAISPRARKLASSESLDASLLEGTGPGGRVIERDVASALSARPPLTAAANAAIAFGGSVPPQGRALGGRAGFADLVGGLSPKTADYPGKFTDTPVKGVRKIIAERMLASLSSTAQLTLSMTANATRLLALRARFKASEPTLGLTGITIGDLVLYAVSRILPSFPGANAIFENGVLRAFERVHLALAVDTPRGLMVPVIRNADLLSLREISAEAKRLAAACQAGSINPDELSGGTFTVSNLGAFGIESFTPVLNAPQAAILGVDAIMPRAAAGANGTVVLEQRIGLSLTVDHQVIDGAPAARLLKAFADAVADIDLLLLQ